MTNIPSESFKSLKKPNKLILFSFLITLILNITAFFGLDFLDLNVRIIIMLSVIIVVLLVDIISLYIQYFVYYYQTEYLNKIYSLINENIDRIDKSIEKLAQQNIDLKERISKNDQNIKSLQNKLT